MIDTYSVRNLQDAKVDLKGKIALKDPKRPPKKEDPTPKRV